MWKTLTAVLLCAFLHGALAKDTPASFSASQVGTSGLTKQQAKQVLIIVLKHLHFKLEQEGMFIDGDISGKAGKPMRPGYFDFALTYDTPSATATDVLGAYSVDILTGDVIENTRCKRYQFPALSRLQKAISARTGVRLPPIKLALGQVGC